MPDGLKCPQCGLMQLPRPTCKSCGAALGAAIQPSNAAHASGATRGISAPRPTHLRATATVNAASRAGLPDGRREGSHE
mgnify:CR=1 FL=1